MSPAPRGWGGQPRWAKGVLIGLAVVVTLGVVFATGFVGGLVGGAVVQHNDHRERVGPDDDRYWILPPRGDRGPRDEDLGPREERRGDDELGPRGEGRGDDDGRMPGPMMPGQRARLGVVVSDAAGGGAEIVRVVPGSPAADAGLEPGDVIREFDGEQIDDAAALRAATQSADEGQVEVKYTRDGEARTATVRLRGADA